MWYNYFNNNFIYSRNRKHMKTLTKSMPIVFLLAFIVGACWSNESKDNSAAVNMTPNELKLEKDTLRHYLKESGNKLELAMKRLENKLLKEKDAVKTSFMNEQKQLIQQKADVDKKLKELDVTSVNEWDEFKHDLKKLNENINEGLTSLNKKWEEKTETD